MKFDTTRPSSRAHARAVGVEDAHDADVEAVVAVVGHRHRLGEPLGLVVDAARTDRVDVAPVGLGLRVDLRVAVDLAGRGQEEAGVLGLGQAERVVRAEAADLQRLDRHLEVVLRRGRAGEVQHARRPRPATQQVVADVVLDEREPGCPKRCSMLSSEPVMRLSRQTTSSPRSSSASQRCEPRNPAPPVTTMRAISCARCPGTSNPRRAQRGAVEQVAGVDDARLGHARPPCRGRASGTRPTR